MAQHKQQVRREAQVCQEGRAGARTSTPGAAVWKREGQKIFSSLRYESKKRGKEEGIQNYQGGLWSEDTRKAVLDPRVPEFISAIPLPLENPKQVKEPKKLNQVKVKFQENSYPGVRRPG